jgi:hypothetical protein
MVFLGSLPKNLILRRSPLEYLGVNSTTVSKDGYAGSVCCPSFETALRASSG